MKEVRVLIADDDDLVRDGVRMLLGARDHLQICGEASTGRETVALAKSLKPDVVVVDFGIPELHGLEATRQIRSAVPRTEVLMLVPRPVTELARDVLAAGASGLVLRTAARRHLVPAVESLGRRQPYLCPNFPRSLLRLAARRAASQTAPSGLTPREREIVQLIAAGLRSKEIASRLSLSPRTVDTHRANIMRKLGLDSLSQLVLYAVRQGLVRS